MVHDNQKTSPEPPARKTGHKRVKLKSFMDYIDICLAENVQNDEVIFAEIKAMVYGPTFHAALLHSART